MDACYTEKQQPTICLAKRKKKAELFGTSGTSGASLFLFCTGKEQTNKEELKSEAKGCFFCIKVDRPANLTNMQMIIIMCTFWCQLVSFLHFPFFMYSMNLSPSLPPVAGRIVHLCVLFAQVRDSTVLYFDLNGVSFVCASSKKAQNITRSRRRWWMCSRSSTSASTSSRNWSAQTRR